jgi:hypothetical protein
MAADATAQAVLADIARRGAKTVLDELYGDDARWRGALEGIAAGQPEWLEAAQRLKMVAGPVAPELTVVVAEALEHAPRSVLAILDRGAFDTDDVCSLNTIEDALGNEYEAAVQAIDRRQRAVSQVGLPALAARRRECLAFLAELKRVVVRNREELFPTR